ncbi:Long-chain fatty acid transport protein [Loktanella atrilutea]|uniref:Long-chain fatty acid transport protein n=1 Tax=Loktanella atrilutea TaxID=366533 RepID=A0A1M4TPD6_LOKAT|nr:hypothetical protein [Loktanella atrilutea]SHE46379.1 Long-chain fatty acid transport protein [Loktanella atrilutea]
MKKLTTAAALLLTTTGAHAAGIDRNLTNYGTLFEPGNYVELSYAAVKPSVSGTYQAPFDTLGGSASTGVMSKDFSTLSGSLKYDLTPRLALGLFFNQPFGADADYPQGFYRGLSAEWDSNGQTIMMKYKVTPAISVYGGVRSIESEANIVIPSQLLGASTGQELGARAGQAGAAAQEKADLARAAGAAAAAAQADGDLAQAQQLGAQAAALAAQAQALQAQAIELGGQAQAILDPNSALTGRFTYTAHAEKDRQTSYVIGAAYEKPEIALRVAFTYESGYTHKFSTTETFGGADLPPSTTSISMPDVYTLDFQSGVAQDTLVFGSIRHATWSDWHVKPAGYANITGGEEVTGIDSDSTTYRLGVGRKFSDNVSGFVRVTYEPSNGDDLSRLAPTDGSTSFGVGGTYTRDAFKITGGVEYIKFGEGNDDPARTNTRFADNDAVAVGLSVGYRF